MAALPECEPEGDDNKDCGRRKASVPGTMNQ
jgi:hypothetical protein